MFPKKYQWLSLLLVALIATPAWAENEFTVSKSRIEDLKAVFATVETVDVISARARIGGTVSVLNVDEGAAVKQGQSIAVVGDAKLGLQMKALRARIQSLIAEKNLAVTARDRARKLKESGTIPQKGLDEAETAVDVIERNLLALKAELSVVSEQQSEGAVKAPSGGRVTKVHVTQGAVVLPGEVIATIAAKGFILRLSLPERHARFIHVGDEVRVGDDDSAERKGRIQQVYPEISKGRVEADVAVEGLGDFFVGERIRARVGAGERDVLVVPEEFLFQRFGLTFVTLKNGGDIVVQPGLNQSGGVEILSGLREGDVLVKPTAD